VAERGVDPLIIFYKWPEKEIVSILRNATSHAYSCITFRWGQGRAMSSDFATIGRLLRLLTLGGF
jgi:hypothetical protein